MSIPFAKNIYMKSQRGLSVKVTYKVDFLARIKGEFFYYMRVLTSQENCFFYTGTQTIMTVDF